MGSIAGRSSTTTESVTSPLTASITVSPTRARTWARRERDGATSMWAFTTRPGVAGAGPASVLVGAGEGVGEAAPRRVGWGCGATLAAKAGGALSTATKEIKRRPNIDPDQALHRIFSQKGF